MIGMPLAISIYVDRMPHFIYSKPMDKGGWQETEE
jgi:hypothetical protein